MQWAVSYKALQDWFYPVENALVVSAELHNDLSENSYIQPADRSGDFPVMVKLTDPAFFQDIFFPIPGRQSIHGIRPGKWHFHCCRYR